MADGWVWGHKQTKHFYSRIHTSCEGNLSTIAPIDPSTETLPKKELVIIQQAYELPGLCVHGVSSCYRTSVFRKYYTFCLSYISPAKYGPSELSGPSEPPNLSTAQTVQLQLARLLYLN